jgi:deoxyribodipyrimidine photo-lyase
VQSLAGFIRDLQAWQTGLTGYPLVDAGMRQLAQTGWLHNRAPYHGLLPRQTLLIDGIWRRRFMRHLLDGDRPVNNGGWQWLRHRSDAAPYFRIFNPGLQSRKFDPAGFYSRLGSGTRQCSAIYLTNPG